MSDEAKNQREDDALGVLLSYIRETRGEEWEDKGKPDKLIRNRPACDRLITEAESGKQALVEITSFDWPMDRMTTQMRLRSLARDLEAALVDEAKGHYTIAASINEVTEARLFHQKKRPEMKQSLRGWFAGQGAEMKPRETTGVPDVPGLAVTRLTLSGSIRITVPTTITRIEHPNWMSDLESVMEENAAKFDGISGMLRWLLVPCIGISGRLEISGPVLKVPSQVDELFFIDYEDKSEDWPPREIRSAIPHIIEYSKVKQPNHGGKYDRETGTVKVVVPFVGEG